MASFPDSIIPNRLVPETQREVDGNPSIFNAKDYNVHRRELRAIEKRAMAMTNAIDSAKEKMGYVSSGNLFQYHSGGTTIATGSVGSTPVPSSLVLTSTGEAIETGAAIIVVDDTSAFPSSGYITKFNNNVGSPGDPLSLILSASTLPPTAYSGTNQEIIQYSSKTATTFNGCTRGKFGTTIQRQPASSESVSNPLGTNRCLILGGRATFSIYPSTLAKSGSTFYEYMLEHDAMLRFRIRLLKDGTAVSDSCVLRYVLMAIGQFDDLDLGALLED
jgi:hypothetical protein